MSAEATLADTAPGAMFLTRTDLDDALSILGVSERRQGERIAVQALDDAGLENLMVGVEAAAALTAAIMAEIGNRGAGMREQLAVVELVNLRAGQLLLERQTADTGPVGRA